MADSRNPYGESYCSCRLTREWRLQLYERASQKLGLDRVLRHYEKEGMVDGAVGGGGSKDANKIDADDVQQMLRYAAPPHGLQPDIMASITSDCDAMRCPSIKWP